MQVKQPQFEGDGIYSVKKKRRRLKCASSQIKWKVLVKVQFVHCSIAPVGLAWRLQTDP